MTLMLIIFKFLKKKDLVQKIHLNTFLNIMIMIPLDHYV